MTTSSLQTTSMAATEDTYLFPTSLAQQRLWFLHQMEPQSPAYNIAANLRLNMPVNIQVLQASLNALIERHEALRTCFVTTDDIDGSPMQKIMPAFSLSLPLVDLSMLPEQHEETLRLANEEAQRPFDLEQTPLLRAKLLKLAQQDFVLLLTMHHIISDGWSINIFFHELTVLYDALIQGQPSPLPPPTLQYVDFAIYQHEHIKEDGLAEHLAYWKQQLAGAATTLHLPTDHPRPTTHSTRGSRHITTLPLTLAEALKAVSREHRVTLYMTLVAAFQCLLFRYCSQEDILIGTAASGRTLPGTEALFGFFVNTLVLRTDLSGSPTFSELLGRVREVVLQAQAHQDMPFDHLVKMLQPERVSGQNPLFQVFISLNPPTTNSSPSWIPNPITSQTNTAKFDLTLELSEHAAGIDCIFEFSLELFEEATIRRMVGHWHTLLAGIVADPDQRVVDLPLLTEQERDQLLITWNETQQFLLPEHESILPLFEEQVRRQPEAVAVISEQHLLTYDQLNQRANQLAHTLRSLGVGPEVMVGLCLERSLGLIVGLLGILKAGGVYVPLAPDAPAQRLRFQLQNTGMPILLTQTTLLARLPQQAGVHLLCLDRDWPQITRESTANPSWHISGERLAYVIYTSGSTGQPKGVLIEHQALLAHCQTVIQEYALQPADRILQFSSLAFDASLEQILPTLLAGARLILRQEQLWSPTQLLQHIGQQQISIINLPPAYWQQVSQAWSQLPAARATRSRLRLVILGGEQLPPEALRLWQQTPWQAVRVLNAYGPTEATITATLYDTTPLLDEGRSSEQRRVPIGRPLPNRSAYVLDPAGQLAPIGVAGELYLGGACLARGYLHHPVLTAQRFVPDPFSTHAGARLYKTGDLARWLPSGTLEILGRLDQQVKLRGFRIELGEIEAVLTQHPAVAEVAVLLRDEPNTDKHLLAYLVARPGQSLEPDLLRRYLHERLPAYMIPNSYALLDALPWLPSGKLDRKALLALKPDRCTTEEATFIAPKSLIHQQLVQIWEDLLEIETETEARPIGISDNFFYLGGHSLLAARLVDRIEQVFGKSIALSTLFSGPTIERLAEALEQQERADERTPIFPIQVKGPRSRKSPLFFLHGDWGGGAFYCFTLARALGTDQPFYALAPYRFDGLRTLPTFEEVAAAHIAAIRAVQPAGPYLLGGFCNGGLLAYEMARQLTAVGERVDFLALINPSPPIQFEKMRIIRKYVQKLLRHSEGQQAQHFLSGRHAFRHIYRTLNPSGARVEDFDTLLDLDPRLKAMFPPVEALHNDYVGVFSWLVSRYTTGIYPGKIAFYWASEEPLMEKAWQPVIAAKDNRDIERCIVPGTHMTCVTNHIQDLAACLSASLQRVQEEAVIHDHVKVAVKVAR